MTAIKRPKPSKGSITRSLRTLKVKTGPGAVPGSKLSLEAAGKLSKIII